jgi:hypothetical protein
VTELVAATISLTSKYNTLDARASLGMKPFEVDIKRHEDIGNVYASELFAYDFYLKDTIKADEFIHQQIYRPSGMVQAPRSAQSSVTKVTTPLGIDVTVQLDRTNLINPSKIKSSRTVSKYFYNLATFRYEQDSITDDFLGTEVGVSSESFNRIKVGGNRDYKIEAKGIRALPDPTNIMQAVINRILKRYEFGAEVWEVETTLGRGMPIEVGDLIILDGDSLGLADTKDNAGSRVFKGYYCEVINKTVNIKQGNCKFTLINSNYSTEYRYGVISPSSRTTSGSTTTKLNLTPSYGTTLYSYTEEWKWRDYVGQQVLVRSDDYTTYYQITNIAAVGTNFLTVTPLPSAPPAGYVVEVPPYPAGSNPTDNELYKKNFAFFDPTVQIVSATSTTIKVGPSDIFKFVVGGIIIAHDYSWTYFTNRPRIVQVLGNTIYLSAPLSTVPSVGHYIDLIGFPDGGAPYAWA